MAAMELDLAGGRMANRVAQSWKMRLCVLESHSLPRISPSLCSPLSSSISLFFTLYSPRRKYMSIYRRARDHVILCD